MSLEFEADAPKAPATPNPTPLCRPMRSGAEVQGHRNLFCPFYESCLNTCIRKGWESWSCQFCTLREPDKQDEADRLEQTAHGRRRNPMNP